MAFVGTNFWCRVPTTTGRGQNSFRRSTPSCGHAFGTSTWKGCGACVGSALPIVGLGRAQCLPKGARRGNTCPRAHGGGCVLGCGPVKPLSSPLLLCPRAPGLPGPDRGFGRYPFLGFVRKKTSSKRGVNLGGGGAPILTPRPPPPGTPRMFGTWGVEN